MCKKDASKYTSISDHFIKEVHETWTEINFENTINSLGQFRQQYLWQNSLIKIEIQTYLPIKTGLKRNRTGKTYNEKRVPVPHP